MLLDHAPSSASRPRFRNALRAAARSATTEDDGSGKVAASYSYEPFGKLKSSTGTVTNPYRWLGGLGVYHDTTTGLYKMGTRYNDPALGRFTQVDPLREDRRMPMIMLRRIRSTPLT